MAISVNKTENNFFPQLSYVQPVLLLVLNSFVSYCISCGSALLCCDFNTAAVFIVSIGLLYAWKTHGFKLLVQTLLSVAGTISSLQGPRGFDGIQGKTGMRGQPGIPVGNSWPRLGMVVCSCEDDAPFICFPQARATTTLMKIEIQIFNHDASFFPLLFSGWNLKHFFFPFKCMQM